MYLYVLSSEVYDSAVLSSISFLRLLQDSPKVPAHLFRMFLRLPASDVYVTPVSLPVQPQPISPREPSTVVFLFFKPCILPRRYRDRTAHVFGCSTAFPHITLPSHKDLKLMFVVSLPVAFPY